MIQKQGGSVGNHVIAERKLGDLDCYHLFLGPRDTKEPRKHSENLPPKMIPMSDFGPPG